MSAPRPLRWLSCSACDEPLTEPGALLFSPPDESDSCKKLHLCATCYKRTIESLRLPAPPVLEYRFAALEQWLMFKAYDDTTAEQCAQWKLAAEHLGHAANCMSVLDAMEKGDPNE